MILDYMDGNPEYRARREEARTLNEGMEGGAGASGRDGAEDET
jgi:hypothetical protein